MTPAHQEPVEGHLYPEDRCWRAAPPHKVKHREVMSGGDDSAKVEQGLLRHREMHKIWFKSFELAPKSNLLQRVERKLGVGAGEGSKIFPFHRPFIIWLDEDGVTVVGVDLLQVFDKAIGIATSTRTAVARINYDMRDCFHCYNYTE